ncbi:MAG: hypothetical protein RIR36_704, partial [Bacteroidota bacterium]
CLIYLAGLPPQISLSGTDLETTLPAATMELLPIVTPLSIIEFAPIKHPSFSKTGLVFIFEIL